MSDDPRKLWLLLPSGYGRSSGELEFGCVEFDCGPQSSRNSIEVVIGKPFDIRGYTSYYRIPIRREVRTLFDDSNRVVAVRGGQLEENGKPVFWTGMPVDELKKRYGVIVPVRPIGDKFEFVRQKGAFQDSWGYFRSCHLLALVGAGQVVGEVALSAKDIR